MLCIRFSWPLSTPTSIDLSYHHSWSPERDIVRICSSSSCCKSEESCCIADLLNLPSRWGLFVVPFSGEVNRDAIVMDLWISVLPSDSTRCSPSFWLWESLCLWQVLRIYLVQGYFYWHVLVFSYETRWHVQYWSWLIWLLHMTCCSVEAVFYFQLFRWIMSWKAVWKANLWHLSWFGHVDFFFQSETFLNLFALDCKGQVCCSVSNNFALLIME